MIIVWTIDKKYSGYAKISIESYKSKNPSAKCVVVSEEPLPEDIGYDENVIIKLPKVFRNKGAGDRITNTAYLKLFLTQLPYDKIIYVDADTVCQHSLDEVWDMPCEYINICESHNFGKQQAKVIGVDKYGCTGFMVMNLSKLRQIGFTERCLKVQDLDIPSEWWQHDETSILVGMNGLLTFIDKKYCYCFNREYDDPIPYTDAYILHFIGKDKAKMSLTIHYPELYPMKQDIEGKRVAIVGNAQSLLDQHYGSEIDDHDFIIRFNRGFIIKPEAQGTKTTLLITATDLTDDELKRYNAKYTANRSANYHSNTDFTINSWERCKMASAIGSQPSTGFMALNICLYFGAKEIDLYGFDHINQNSWPNPEGYVTPHNYSKEQEILRGYEVNGLINIRKGA